MVDWQNTINANFNTSHASLWISDIILRPLTNDFGFLLTSIPYLSPDLCDDNYNFTGQSTNFINLTLKLSCTSTKDSAFIGSQSKI